MRLLSNKDVEKELNSAILGLKIAVWQEKVKSRISKLMKGIIPLLGLSVPFCIIALGVLFIINEFAGKGQNHIVRVKDKYIVALPSEGRWRPFYITFEYEGTTYNALAGEDFYHRYEIGDKIGVRLKHRIFMGSPHFDEFWEGPNLLNSKD